MADDKSAEPEGGGSVSIDQLTSELNERKQVLAELRAQRERAQLDATTEIHRASLKAELDRVNQQIQAEESLLQTQQNVDPEVIANGPSDNPEPAETATEATSPDELEGEADTSVDPSADTEVVSGTAPAVPTVVTSGENDTDTSEGSEQ